MLRVGDKVKLRRNLIDNRMYDGILYIDTMGKFCRCQTKVIKEVVNEDFRISPAYRLVGDPNQFLYTEVMFSHITPMVLELTMQEIEEKYGCKVKVIR